MASPIDQETALQSRDLPTIFRVWEEKIANPGFDPLPFIIRLSELFEEETEIYLQKDPDPFDERHPSRTDPESELGRMLKLLFRKDNLMTRLVNDYMRDNFFTRQNIQKSSLELNIAASRLILVILPGLETSAVFQADFDNLIQRLCVWATDSPEPLQSYATGLLASAMEVQDIAINFREQNAKLVPLMLSRLATIQTKPPTDKLFSDTIVEPDETHEDDSLEEEKSPEYYAPTMEGMLNHLGGGSEPSSPNSSKSGSSLKMNGMSKFQKTPNLSTLVSIEENKNISEGNRLPRNMIQFHPPTIATSQMLILRYLTTMGEYQEFLCHVFEYNAMQIIFRYIENLDQKDTCLAFESLKYLAALLCHKKFCLEFISNGGLQRLLLVPRPSVAATGVSISLYYLAYCEDAMERICTMPKIHITELISYALWLLGCSHDSGRCHATMFFGLSFQFKVILDEFDKQDGLRKLYNVIAILPILLIDDDSNLNDDEEYAERQIVRHVCVALKKYMESHLYYKYTQTTRQHNSSGSRAQPIVRACNTSSEVINDQVRTLQEMLPMRAPWSPVDELLRLSGITLLLRVIAIAYEWNYTGRAETVRSVLDVLTICSVISKVHHVFCERIELPDDPHASGFNVILGAAVGEIVADVDVQKSALAVLVNCVCAPIHRPSGLLGRFGSAKKKATNKNSEELIQKVWECVRSTNGIIVLLQLMQTKGPITDADCIRGLACRALAGLARSDTVKQIMSKLPLFTNGQLQVLMRDPILQEKRAEHVMFQKYAFELMERVSGKSKSQNSEFDTSLANIHKANVVAQTKIQFNEQQLHHLIYQHLVSRGLNNAASALKQEAGLNTFIQPRQVPHSLFNYSSPVSGLLSRSRLKPKGIDLSANLPATINNTSHLDVSNNKNIDSDEPMIGILTNTPIKIIKKHHAITPNSASSSGTQQQQRSLQKQISSADGFITSAQRSNQIDTIVNKNVTLDTIITEYLTNQHGLCKNPMSTCPQFDLFLPHKCPDPRPNKVHGLSNNFAARYYRRQAGFNSKRLDRRLVHSQFSVVRTLRPQDSELFFTCCCFTACASNMIVGSYNGDVKVFNINQNAEEFSYNCHESFINSIKCSRDGTLVLMSCAYRSPMSSLWNIENKQFTHKLQWDDEEYCEFNNLQQDKILGTKSEIATIYDLQTGQKISTFTPNNFNQYTKNRATFCPTDELILSDGVLWDVKSGKDIHKFDKLNQTYSGVFHPDGLEIVSNTEVWDLRTFHLLRTVLILDQCQVSFSPQNIIYGTCPKPDEASAEPDTYESNFKTLDSYDYSSIATVDVKRCIYDLSVNKTGSHIAIVENQGEYDSVQESVVRIYNVGRRKNTEDDVEEEDEEIEGSDEGSLSDAESVANVLGFLSRQNANYGQRLFDFANTLSSDSSDSNNSNDNDNDNDDDDDFDNSTWTTEDDDDDQDDDMNWFNG